MAFDATKFETTEFKDRIETVPVPELKDFFGEEEEPVWLVRGLNASELAIVNESMMASVTMNTVLDAVAAHTKSERIIEARRVLGLSEEDVPKDVVRRIAILKAGSVEPKCSQRMAVKLGSTHPYTLFNLTNRILDLTGQGKQGESPPCGEMGESGQV